MCPRIKSPLLYSILLIDLYRIVPGRAVLCRSADDRGAGAYRSLPGCTGTAEQTWSNRGNRKITAAGIVLAGTFAALTQIPEVSITEVGTAVALGVLLDTLLVRTILVPASLLTIGERVWWPARAGTDRRGADR